MKHLKTILLVVAALMVATTTSARTWRVNPNPNSGAQFNSVDALNNSADFLEGDTIIFDPGAYGSISISRKNITLIGPGYFLSQNKDLAISNSATFDDIVLNEGCKAIGLQANIIRFFDNCEVSRCKATEIYGYGGTRSFVTISNNYVGTIDRIVNGVIRNNIIKDQIYYVYSCDVINNTFVKTGENVFIGYETADSNIKDNIFINFTTGVTSDGVPYANNCIDFESAQAKNNNISYNVFSIGERWANESYTVGNKYCGATLQSTFVNEGSDDGKYQLCEGSPAKGAASNGGDCGAFGGATPYVLSGIPAFMPQITDLVVPSSPTDGKITVKLTIATQNE